MNDRRAVGLDLVRFAAAMMVVLAHVGVSNGLSFALPDAFAGLGGIGVSLFFALSGYLLWRPLVTGKPGLGAYAANRLARILPAFWLACLVLVPLRGGNLLSYLVMLPDRGSPLGVIWTLQAEVMFYVALPYLARIGRPLAVPIVGGLLSLALELAIAGTPAHATVVESLLPVRFWAFAPGMVLAAWRPKTDWRWLIAGAAFLVVGVAYLPFTPGGGQYADVPAVIGAGFIVGWGIQARPRGALLWSAGAAISYGLYLWHLDLFRQLGDLGVPLTIAVASLSYVLLERPILRWVKARTSGIRTPSEILEPGPRAIAAEAVAG
ncbi:MAG TPA: acyltransferase [Candidatus Limnocylindrales bacterium]|nr:acyltransferase [Candidatus Limnocylindrales bacterium]